MKIAVLFSGQGQQAAAMGTELYQQESTYRQVVDQVNQTLSWDLTRSADWIDDPTRVPVAITAMSLASYRLLGTTAAKPVVLTGLSLGEYGALMAANVMAVRDGIKVVADRARYMQRAGLQRPGQMVAALKVTPDIAQAACAAAQTVGVAYPANYNLADQVVIGGDVAGVRAASDYLHAQGVKRVVPLDVAVASHTPLMRTASEALAKRLGFVNVRVPQVPVISNTTVAPFSATEVKTTLVQQLIQPTHFAACLQRIATYDLDAIVQVGPGNNLAKFAQKTVPTVPVYTMTTVADWQTLRTVLKEEN